MIAMYTCSDVLRDQNGLVFTIWKRTNNITVINIMMYTFTLEHVSVGIIGNGKNMWWHFSSSSSFVHVDYLFSINR